MELFDIFDEIAEKQIMKTETGDNRIFGVVLGLVTDNYDKEMKGRVCVTVPSRDTDANNLKWARVAMLSSGRKWGHYFLPEVGDQVLLAFEQGNIEKPYVIGCIPKEQDTFFREVVDEQNQKKCIMTKNGSMIQFYDAQEGDGTKDRITIETPQEAHQIVLDNEKSEILISDKDGSNSIALRTESGNLVIKAKQKLTIEVGDNIKVSMNGENGTVSIDCSKLKVKADGDVSVAANGNSKLSGGNVSVQATTALKLESSATTKIGGTPISIG